MIGGKHMTKIGEIISISDSKEIKSKFDVAYDTREFHRGEIYFIDLEELDYLSEHIMSKSRPGLIIQNDIGNQRGEILIVALLTSGYRKDYPFQYKAQINGRESVIMFDQIMSIDKSRVMGKLGELMPAQMREADKRLMYSLALNPLSFSNVIDFDIVSRVSKKTKSTEYTYFEISLSLKEGTPIFVNISLEKLKYFKPEISYNTDFSDLKKMLDSCKGLHWIAENAEYQ
jgi:mRNA-degrading endonuclease toxin of MazEF toxin-antitoxin module